MEILKTFICDIKSNNPEYIDDLFKVHLLENGLYVKDYNNPNMRVISLQEGLQEALKLINN